MLFKRLLKGFTFAISAIFSCTVCVQAVEPPNVIIILNDDQGYQDLGCFGSPDIKTPHVDRLAEEGIRFTDFYAASSVCSASRASLMTGMYPRRLGIRRVFFPNRDAPDGLSPEHTTIAEVLKSVGYATKAVGKWHLGDRKQYLPTNQGFDSYYGIPYSNDMFPAQDMDYAEDCLYREGHTQASMQAAFLEIGSTGYRGYKQYFRDCVPLMRDTECVEFPVDQRTITRRFADEGIQFITESVEADQPFFLYLANSMPHTPLFVSDDFVGKSERGLYGDVIEEIDHNVGRLMAHLESLNVVENTLVIYTSDNGPWLVKGEEGGSALPLFEGKMTAFEGGQRVPTVMRWPKQIPAGKTCSEVASTIDLLPTLAAVTGAVLDVDTSLDGGNIFDLMVQREGAQSPHEYFFYEGNAVRNGDWKYHRKEHFKVKATARSDEGPTLYNLKEDIGETNNLIGTYPEIAERLKLALNKHMQRGADF